jgi:hypothetical protein
MGFERYRRIGYGRTAYLFAGGRDRSPSLKPPAYALFFVVKFSWIVVGDIVYERIVLLTAKNQGFVEMKLSSQCGQSVKI